MGLAAVTIAIFVVIGIVLKYIINDIFPKKINNAIYYALSIELS